MYEVLLLTFHIIFKRYHTWLSISINTSLGPGGQRSGIEDIVARPILCVMSGSEHNFGFFTFSGMYSLASIVYGIMDTQQLTLLFQLSTRTRYYLRLLSVVVV